MHPTLDQVMCGLRQIVHDELHIRAPFTPETRIYEYLDQHNDDLGFDFEYLNGTFGLKLTAADWLELFWAGVQSHKQWLAEVAPTRTFGWLAGEIAQRAEVPSMEPALLLGKPCKAAGVFLGVEQLVRELDPKVTRFAPSTPIRDRLRGHPLRDLWRRLEWITRDRLGTLPKVHEISPAWAAASYGVSALAWFMCLSIVAAFIFGVWWMGLFSEGGAIVATILTASLTLVAGAFLDLWLSRRLDCCSDPLPTGIVTFRDLVRHVQRPRSSMPEVD